MKVFIVSHNYPSAEQPYIHTFVKDHFDVVKKMDGITPELLIPTPRLIPFTRRHKLQNSTLLDSESGQRIHYISIPKMLRPKRVQKNITKKLLNFLPPSDKCIVHLHWIYPSGLAIPELNKFGYKTVLTIHRGDWYQTISQPKLLPIIKRVLSSADTLLVSGPRLKDDILKIFPDLNIEVSYNYINTKQFLIPAKEVRLRSKKALGWDESKINFFTVANIRFEKGIDCLLDTIRDLNRNDLHFHILGQPGKRNYGKLITSKTESMKGDPITFYNPISRNELVNYYNAADAYILPSRSEGFNVSLLEALATGLPVIATKTGGAELLIENCGGFLAEPGSVRSLVKCLNEYPTRRSQERSNRSVKYVQEHFSFKQYQTFLQGIYKPS
ncbi:MAG: glycosyltransferase family 4 protein [Balneolaceae bacterium]